MRDRRRSRRELMLTGGWLLAAPLLHGAGWMSAPSPLLAAPPRLRVTGVDLLPIRATSRTVWLIVRLRTDTGLVGLGEASDAFGFANTTVDDAKAMQAQLQIFFKMIEGRSPFEIEVYRQRGLPLARAGLVPATAFSAIEQALWDIAARALDVPVHVLFGGKLRDTLPVYANVNRATNPRTPEGFAAAARRAVADGFTAVKAAPFDGFPPAGSSAKQIEDAVKVGIASVVSMREAVGPRVRVMIDCHSFFDVELAVRVARELEPQSLTWYEEPVAPEKIDETVAIRSRIRQPMAAGEVLFGVAGFSPLVRRRAVEVIMPDVKHCGGLLELKHIAALAASEGIAVAPHNPSGPISTAATAHVASTIENVNFLELQYGEVDWRSDLLTPPERFIDGTIRVGEGPGFGVSLNEAAIRERLMPLR